MLCTLTLNPALDYIMEAPALVPGETNRARTCRMAAGGKGINVSLMAHRLGYETVPCGVAAGITGTYLLDSLRAAGLTPDFLLCDPSGGADVWTRINVKLSAPGGAELEVNAPGAPLAADTLDRLAERLAARLSPGDTLALCGSLPAGAAPDTYARLLDRLAACGIDPSRLRLAADTTGERLLALLPYHPFVIKPNLSELEELTGRCCRAGGAVSYPAVADAGRQLQRAGARNVLVSLGAAGAVLVPEDGPALRIGAAARPEDVTSFCTTGAGDSMLAGFLCTVGEQESCRYARALRIASLCGAATAFTPDGIADAALVQRLGRLSDLPVVSAEA